MYNDTAGTDRTEKRYKDGDKQCNANVKPLWYFQKKKKGCEFHHSNH